MKRVVILQPGYLPWLGFFEQMHRCDFFLFIDDVQYTKQDWRSRNRIKSPEGFTWLTVPVLSRGRTGQKICEAEIDNHDKWQIRHLRGFERYYKKSPYLNIYFNELEHFYNKTYRFISTMDVDLTMWLNEKLGLERPIEFTSNMKIESTDRQDRIIEICRQIGADFFYEGKAGENFIEIDRFAEHGITVEFQHYSHPYYNQQWTEKVGFISHLSILDLLFNHGADSLDILTGKKSIPIPEGVKVRHADELEALKVTRGNES